MALFRKACVIVLCLPSHTTHVLQIFNVALAAPLKRVFGSLFKKELKKAARNQEITTNAGKYRFACIIALTYLFLFSQSLLYHVLARFNESHKSHKIIK